ncbi:hypothetical protein [Acetobacterium wieringae]|uniref:hypothetical protein n=1 Tax=Acetobacterium wieringae TaxID=52694 RepID=UPI0031589D4B
MMKNKSNLIKEQASLADNLLSEFNAKWNCDQQTEDDETSEKFANLKKQSSSHSRINEIRGVIHRK